MNIPIQSTSDNITTNEVLDWLEADGKWHTYFYDKDGKTMDVCVR